MFLKQEIPEMNDFKGSRKKKVLLLMEKEIYFGTFFKLCCYFKTIYMFYVRQLIEIWTHQVKVCW